jgi:hypothetical protein
MGGFEYRMEETIPRMRVLNPHLKPRFPRRRTQIAMGEVLEPRALCGEGVCKEGNCLGERGPRAILETVVTGLTGIENQSDRYLKPVWQVFTDRQWKPVPRRFSSSWKIWGFMREKMFHFENLRFMYLRSVFSLMASQQATKVNYSHEWVDTVTKTKRSKYFENHTT